MGALMVSVPVVPRLVPFVVGEGQGGGPLLDEAGKLLGDAGPGKEAARLVRAHAAEPVGEPRVLEHLHDGNAEVLLVERVGVERVPAEGDGPEQATRLNSSHQIISYAVFCLKKKNTLTDT